MKSANGLVDSFVDPSFMVNRELLRHLSQAWPSVRVPYASRGYGSRSCQRQPCRGVQNYQCASQADRHVDPRRDHQGANPHKLQTKKNRPPRAGFYPSPKTQTRDQNSIGAGEGNRTLVISLGSWSNAIIRHPLGAADFVPDVGTDLKFFFTWGAVSRLREPQTRAVVGGQTPLLKAQEGACSPRLGFR